jgi:hypothetical protein
MDDLTRRQALLLAAAPGLALAPEAAPAQGEPKRDRDYVIAAGMTEAEADCWAAVADAAGKFFELPELHPMDKQEVATAIHVVQNKLLGRPTYRKYLELAKKAYEAGDKK